MTILKTLINFFKKLFKKNRKYGWKKDRTDHRDIKFRASTPIDLPAFVDLSAGIPIIYDQGSLGSCTANAIGACIQYNQIKQNKALDFIPSRLFIYYNEREMEGTVNMDCGAAIRDGIKVVNQLGVCKEQTWPYDIPKFRIKPNLDAYVDAEKHQVLDYACLNNQNLNELKTCIASGFPFVFGFQVYDYFEGKEIAKTGILKMPQPEEQNLGGHAVTCLHEDTKICLLDGRDISLKDAYDEFGSGEFWVYSCNENGHIVAGKAHSLKKTGVNRNLLEIILDNGETIKCTPDHKFMMKDGSYKEAKDLNIEDSLKPLYRKKSEEEGMSGYEMILQTDINKWQYTHRAIASSEENYKGGVVHHKNFIKTNNVPSNLQIMSWEEHTKLHSEQMYVLTEYAKSEKGREKSRELMKKL